MAHKHSVDNRNRRSLAEHATLISSKITLLAREAQQLIVQYRQTSQSSPPQPNANEKSSLLSEQFQKIPPIIEEINELINDFPAFPLARNLTEIPERIAEIKEMLLKQESTLVNRLPHMTLQLLASVKAKVTLHLEQCREAEELSAQQNSNESHLDIAIKQKPATAVNQSLERDSETETSISLTTVKSVSEQQIKQTSLTEREQYNISVQTAEMQKDGQENLAVTCSLKRVSFSASPGIKAKVAFFEKVIESSSVPSSPIKIPKSPSFQIKRANKSVQNISDQKRASGSVFENPSGALSEPIAIKGSENVSADGGKELADKSNQVKSEEPRQRKDEMVEQPKESVISRDKVKLEKELILSPRMLKLRMDSGSNSAMTKSNETLSSLADNLENENTHPLSPSIPPVLPFRKESLRDTPAMPVSPTPPQRRLSFLVKQQGNGASELFEKDLPVKKPEIEATRLPQTKSKEMIAQALNSPKIHKIDNMLNEFANFIHEENLKSEISPNTKIEIQEEQEIGLEPSKSQQSLTDKEYLPKAAVRKSKHQSKWPAMTKDEIDEYLKKLPLNGAPEIVLETLNEQEMLPILSPVQKCLRVNLGIKPAIIGRSNIHKSDNFVPITSSLVISRTHIELSYHGGRFYVKDLGSNSGTWLNYQRLSKPSVVSEPFEIKSGDVLRLGSDYKYAVDEAQQQQKKLDQKHQAIHLRVFTRPSRKGENVIQIRSSLAKILTSFDELERRYNKEPPSSSQQQLKKNTISKEEEDSIYQDRFNFSVRKRTLTNKNTATKRENNNNTVNNDMTLVPQNRQKNSTKTVDKTATSKSSQATPQISRYYFQLTSSTFPTVRLKRISIHNPANSADLTRTNNGSKIISESTDSISDLADLIIGPEIMNISLKQWNSQPKNPKRRLVLHDLRMPIILNSGHNGDSNGVITQRLDCTALEITREGLVSTGLYSMVLLLADSSVLPRNNFPAGGGGAKSSKSVQSQPTPEIKPQCAIKIAKVEISQHKVNVQPCFEVLRYYDTPTFLHLPPGHLHALTSAPISGDDLNIFGKHHGDLNLPIEDLELQTKLTLPSFSIIGDFSLVSKSAGKEEQQSQLPPSSSRDQMISWKGSSFSLNGRVVGDKSAKNHQQQQQNEGSSSNLSESNLLPLKQSTSGDSLTQIKISKQQTEIIATTQSNSSLQHQQNSDGGGGGDSPKIIIVLKQPLPSRTQKLVGEVRVKQMLKVKRSMKEQRLLVGLDLLEDMIWRELFNNCQLANGIEVTRITETTVTTTWQYRREWWSMVLLGAVSLALVCNE